jgi:hypothetical protein
MKRILKSKQKEFFKKCVAMLKELGAVDFPSQYSYNLTIPTRVGALYLRVDPDSTYCFSVFGNFLGNEKEAQAEFGHWKYNFHGSDDGNFTIDEIIEQVKRHIQATF